MLTAPLGITIRMNANTNTITIGGKTLDRSKLSKDDLSLIRRRVRGFYQKEGRR